MLDDDQLEQSVRDLIIDICEILYHRGYDTVPIGAMMRLIGVANESACKHDNEYFALDNDFTSIMESRKITTSEKAPAGVTLH
jgi:hypothetical protein